MKQIRQGLRFNYNTSMQIPISSTIQLVDDFEIEITIRISDLTQSNVYILNKDNYYAIIYNYIPNTIEFYSYIGNGGYTGDDPRVGTQIKILDTNYHTIKYSYDGSVFKGYLDGDLQFSLNKKFKLNINPSNLVIGRSSTTFFKGEISELTITKNNVITVHLPLDEGYGTTAHDTSGNGNHGTIVGATWIIKKAQNVREVRKKLKKNLCPTDASGWEGGSFTSSVGDPFSLSPFSENRIRLNSFIPVEPNRQYTCKVQNGYQFFIVEVSTNNIVTAASGWVTTFSFTTKSNSVKVRIVIRNVVDTALISPSDIGNIKPQLELGNVATEWEPYTLVPDLKPVPKIIVKDTFNRPDNPNSLGVADTGQQWQSLNGTWGVIDNAAYLSNISTAPAICIIPAVADFKMTIKQSIYGAGCGIVFRCSNFSNLFACVVGGSGLVLYRRQAANFIQIGSYNFTPTNNYVIRVEALKDTIKVYVNGILAITVSDTFNQSSGNIGLYMGSTNSHSVPRWDDLFVEKI